MFDLLKLTDERIGRLAFAKRLGSQRGVIEGAEFFHLAVLKKRLPFTIRLARAIGLEAKRLLVMGRQKAKGVERRARLSPFAIHQFNF
jgi:hypothetical protein